MTAPAAVLDVDAATAARARAARIREALVLADELLTQAWEGRDWQVLGLPSWDAYCAELLPELRRIRLTPAELTETVGAMRSRGMSVGAIASALGKGKATVHQYATRAGAAPERVRSTDGRSFHATRRATPRPAPAAPIVARLVALVRAEGPMTGAEVKRRTGLDHGSASAALSRLAAAGRLSYLAPAKRGQHGHYSAPADTLPA